jgi:putative phosphoesterase
MRIGLISDTHVPWVEAALPSDVTGALQGVNLILHAGDIYSHAVLNDLERIAPVLAALGDDDYPTPDARIQPRHVLHVEGLTIWLVHEGPYAPITSEGLPLWLRNRSSPLESGNGKPDIIISGHEHRTKIERGGGVLHVSSGSPTYLHYERGPGTVAILEVSDHRADVRMINL